MLKSALLLTTLFCLTTSLSAANGPTFVSLYKFLGTTDGSLPDVPVQAHNGVLFGTGESGGELNCGFHGCGVVFQLAPPSKPGGKWEETALYNFLGGSDGQSPEGFLFDKAGNLYGVTYIGGGSTNCNLGCGTVYRLSPPANKTGNWTETVLYQFQGETDGAFPEGGLAIDESGNLYGTTTEGGATSCTPFNCGTVWELSPPSSGQGAWTETILYRFQGISDGAFPQGTVVLGPDGALYGSAGPGSSSLSGVVFQLTPPSSGGSWTFSVIYDFGLPTDGKFPVDLAVRQGLIYGLTSTSNDAAGGEFFSLSPSQSGMWTEDVLFNFDGVNPLGPLVFDESGNLYGVTDDGGGSCPNGGCGTVYELSPAQGTWTETVLHNFAGSDGYNPQGVSFAGGTVYGTTYWGGNSCPASPPPQNYGCGTVFKVVP